MTEDEANNIREAIYWMFDDNKADIEVVYNANSGTWFLRMRLLPNSDPYVTIISAFESRTSDYFPQQ